MVGQLHYQSLCCIVINNSSWPCCLKKKRRKKLPVRKINLVLTLGVFASYDTPFLVELRYVLVWIWLRVWSAVSLCLSVYLRKLPDDECPLFLRLCAGPNEKVLSLILKENETGEVNVRKTGPSPHCPHTINTTADSVLPLYIISQFTVPATSPVKVQVSYQRCSVIFYKGSFHV